MSMVGVKNRLLENYQQLETEFSKYFKEVHSKDKNFNPLEGYDQLELKPHEPKSLNQYLLYSAYAQLRLLIDIKPDLINK